ncbi:MAG: histone deacetylase, partial [Verrucomicrobia bacterium]
MKIITDERCASYSSPGHPERPTRIVKTLEKLRSQQEISITWMEPLAVDEAILERAHSKHHIARIKQAQSDFDGDTPAHRDIFDHARRSVGGALQALQSARKGDPVFSLLRPPGHHAMRERAMGFCYLNSIAIAALEALSTGTANLAVYDFDVHHGNGTEAILLNHPHCAYFSIHQHPCYPGTGTSNVGNNCFNY